MPSPPLSPPLAARHTSAAVAKQSASGGRARRGGAAYTITEKCERLFCETLRTVFLGEGNMALQDSLVMGVHDNKQLPTGINDYGVEVQRYPDRLTDLPSPETDRMAVVNGIVSDYIECWDYVGGNRFRGFVAGKGEEKTMFIFFDRTAIGGDLKAGLMALLELCDVPYFSCTRLVACLDRHAETQTTDTLVKDLGWIGFQLTTLDNFTNGDDITSDRWLFMDMDV